MLFWNEWVENRLLALFLKGLISQNEYRSVGEKEDFKNSVNVISLDKATLNKVYLYSLE